MTLGRPLQCVGLTRITFSHGDCLGNQRNELAFGYDFRVASEDQVILQLGAGIEGDCEKSAELFLTTLPSSFSKVRRNGCRRAEELVPQRGVLRAAHSLTCAIDAQCKRMRFLPDVKLLEISHSEGSGRATVSTASFSGGYSP